MVDRKTAAFRKIYEAFSEEHRSLADQAFAKYKKDPSLVNFSQKFRLPDGRGIYGAELNRSWRALAIVEHEVATWFWIGKHEEYDRLLKGLR